MFTLLLQEIARERARVMAQKRATEPTTISEQNTEVVTQPTLKREDNFMVEDTDMVETQQLETPSLDSTPEEAFKDGFEINSIDWMARDLSNVKSTKPKKRAKIVNRKRKLEIDNEKPQDQQDQPSHRHQHNITEQIATEAMKETATEVAESVLT